MCEQASASLTTDDEILGITIRIVALRIHDLIPGIQKVKTPRNRVKGLDAMFKLPVAIFGKTAQSQYTCHDGHDKRVIPTLDASQLTPSNAIRPLKAAVVKRDSNRSLPDLNEF
jgi:hypothetical protein